MRFVKIGPTPIGLDPYQAFDSWPSPYQLVSEQGCHEFHLNFSFPHQFRVSPKFEPKLTSFRFHEFDVFLVVLVHGFGALGLDLRSPLVPHPQFGQNPLKSMIYCSNFREVKNRSESVFTGLAAGNSGEESGSPERRPEIPATDPARRFPYRFASKNFLTKF